MSRKKLLLGILGIAALLLIVAALYVAFQVASGRVIIDLRNDPSIGELKAHVNELTDVQQIEVIYRPKHQWIREPLRNPEYEEVVLTVTDPDEIQQIVNGFREVERIVPYWTQCGFYIRLDLYGAEEQIGTILVGVDDCKSFTTYDIHAVGKMGNDYFYREYVVPLQENR